MNDLKKIFRSFGYAMKGIRHAYSLDRSFRLEVNLGLPVFLGLAWYLFPFAPWELLIYVFAYLLILIVELLNTAFEKMLDRVHPDMHPLTAATKDIGSASVFVAFVFAAIVVFVLVSTRVAHPAVGVLIDHPFV